MAKRFINLEISTVNGQEILTYDEEEVNKIVVVKTELEATIAALEALLREYRILRRKFDPPAGAPKV